MLARTVRIVGPSFCGSTALGCAMNTAPGAFFGSEMYRYLLSWRDHYNGGRFPSCDFCGLDCDFWSAELRADLEARRVDEISEIYRSLCERHPTITLMIDGSKHVPASDDTPHVVVCPTKHPLRLVASYLYNRRARYGIRVDGLEEFASALDALDPLDDIVNRASGYFLSRYRKIAAACPNAHVFRADHAHHDHFAEFRRLEAFLGLASRSFDPARFTSAPAHTIGGNRQPVWMTLRSSGRTSPTTARTVYYDSTQGTGDWKLDDKYSIVFGARSARVVESDDKFLALCALLGYPTDPDGEPVGHLLGVARPG